MNPATNTDGSVLFLSCDLLDSTRFKQSVRQRPSHLVPPELDAGWVPTFLEFYREFPEALGRIVAERHPALIGRLDLWKAIGDELIFSCAIRSESDCYDAVDAWIGAMDDFEQGSLLEKTPMMLKGGAFLATVPFPDRRVAIPRGIVETGTQQDAEKLNEDVLNGEHGAERYVVDFVGPSIDTGFRVLEYAQRRYFVVTLEVAHILFEYAEHHGLARTAHLLGTKRLKGVWDDRPYPLFALARGDDTAPSRLLADIVGEAYVSDEYPACAAEDVVRAVEAYRGTPGWSGVIHLPDSYLDAFREHPGVIAERRRLDALEDHSETPAELDGGAGHLSDIDEMPSD